MQLTTICMCICTYDYLQHSPFGISYFREPLNMIKLHTMMYFKADFICMVLNYCPNLVYVSRPVFS